MEAPAHHHHHPVLAALALHPLAAPHRRHTTHPAAAALHLVITAPHIHLCHPPLHHRHPFTAAAAHHPQAATAAPQAPPAVETQAAPAVEAQVVAPAAVEGPAATAPPLEAVAPQAQAQAQATAPLATRHLQAELAAWEGHVLDGFTAHLSDMSAACAAKMGVRHTSARRFCLGLSGSAHWPGQGLMRTPQ